MSVLRRLGGKRDKIREEEVEETLERHERELEEMAERVRLLEAEAGVYRPPPKKLKEANGI